MFPSEPQTGSYSRVQIHGSCLHGHSPLQAAEILPQFALQGLEYVIPSTPHTGSYSDVQIHDSCLQGHSPLHANMALLQFA